MKNMELKKKWKILFTEMNFNRRWVAKQLGISLPQFANAISGAIDLPKKHWKAIVHLTNGYITMADLYRQWLEDREGVEVLDGGDPWTCVIREKKPTV